MRIDLNFFVSLGILGVLCGHLAAEPLVDDMRSLRDRFKSQRSDVEIASVAAAPRSGSFESLKRRYREAVDCARPYLVESLHAGEEGPGASLSGMVCDDAAPKLATMLRDKGLLAELVVSKGPHVFIRVPHPDGPLYVDPTIRQFFGQSSAPKTVPEIFVGSLAELRSLFSDPRTPPRYRGGADNSWWDFDKNFMTTGDREKFVTTDPDEKMRTNPDDAEWVPLRIFRKDDSCRVGP